MKMNKENYSELVKKVTEWGDQRGITNPDNAKTQALKLGEEYGELLQGMLKVEENLEYMEQITDSLGDMQVVMIILCKQLGVDYEQCLANAYDVIKNRHGKLTKDGSFVKDEDIEN